MNRAVTNQPNPPEAVDGSTEEVQAGGAEDGIDAQAQPTMDGNNRKLPRVESTPTMKVQSS